MLSFFPRGVLDEILNLIESVSEGFHVESPGAEEMKICSNGPGIMAKMAAMLIYD